MTTPDPSASPTPEQIRAHREAVGLTQSQAAALLYKTKRVWLMWEKGDRHMDPALWELFCVKTFLFPKTTKNPHG